MIKSKISIIIPVYNVENYLERCIESVINQTFKDIEIILVDDGSTDNSRAICDKYAKYDERIIVIHKENKGVSSARNVGLNLATGEYIQFIDSDDYIDEGFCEKLNNIIENENPDIIFSGFDMYDEKGMLIKRRAFSEDIKKDINKDIRNDLIKIVETGNYGYTFTKLFKKSIIKKFNVVFDEELSIREDEKFTCEYCKYVNKISIITGTYYKYIKYNNERKTLTSNVHIDKLSIRQNLFNSWVNLFEFLKINDITNRYLYKMAYKDIYFLVFDTIYSSKNNISKLESMRSISNTNIFRYLCKNNKNKNIYIFIFLIKYKCYFLLKIYNRLILKNYSI